MALTHRHLRHNHSVNVPAAFVNVRTSILDHPSSFGVSTRRGTLAVRSGKLSRTGNARGCELGSVFFSLILNMLCEILEILSAHQTLYTTVTI